MTNFLAKCHSICRNCFCCRTSNYEISHCENTWRTRVTNVRAYDPEPEPEPRAYFASHCVFFWVFFFFKFNVNILLSKCYTWLKKQNFPIFFRALISAQVVFLSVSNLISLNGFRRSVYSFRYNLNLEFPSQIFVSK